eukprot:COSAG02_NODE_198_length_29564_cov_12.279009_19_plen_61_part_00
MTILVGLMIFGPGSERRTKNLQAQVEAIATAAKSAGGVKQGSADDDTSGDRVVPQVIELK